MDETAQGRAAAAARTGFYLAAVALLLVLAACTRTYYKEFAVEPQDRAYTPRAQYDDFRAYLRSRGLRTVIETNDFLEVELEPGDTLRVRLGANNRVELTLVRRSRGDNFTAAEVQRFRQTFEGRMRERTGQPITIKLVDERTAPLTNIQ